MEFYFVIFIFLLEMCLQKKNKFQLIEVEIDLLSIDRVAAINWLWLHFTSADIIFCIHQCYGDLYRWQRGRENELSRKKVLIPLDFFFFFLNWIVLRHRFVIQMCWELPVNIFMHESSEIQSMLMMKFNIYEQQAYIY